MITSTEYLKGTIDTLIRFIGVWDGYNFSYNITSGRANDKTIYIVKANWEGESVKVREATEIDEAEYKNKEYTDTIRFSEDATEKEIDSKIEELLTAVRATDI
jgi:hypothetical protein